MRISLRDRSERSSVVVKKKRIAATWLFIAGACIPLALLQLKLTNVLDSRARRRYRASVLSPLAESGMSGSDTGAQFQTFVGMSEID